MSALQPEEPLPDEPRKSPSAEWLVGPDEGLQAEIERGGMESAPVPRPTLLRPAGGAAPPPPPPSQASIPGRVQPEAEDDAIERGPGIMAWSPGASSVPTLRRESGGPRAVPEPTRDFPMDDAEERSSRRGHIAYDEEPRPHEVVTPEAFDVQVAPAPWWMQILHTLGTDRRIQVLVGAVLAILVTVAMWPRGERPMSVSTLRKRATTVDGAQVLVSGKVGQVFPVGGGFAYYLLDGRDTLVVFTRVTHPVTRRPITVRGTMSTGYLDGLPTLALFESNTPR